MARSIRARKTRSVSESLAAHASYQFNQGEVWDGIAELQVDSDTAVHTAFFDLDEETAEGPMSGFHRRRAYRVY